MARYVKFLRGTPTAYKNLAVKDSDTLYFIYEEDESNAVLYLGSKLIAGSNSGTGVDNVKFLTDLKDVLINENIVNNSFLVYNADSNQWVNKSLEDLLFVGATDISSGLGGLVPAPQAGQTDLFLKSDGTWGAPEVNHIILTLENIDKIAHNDLIADATEAIDNVSGDIIIIKDLIYNDKWQYTAYYYDDEWHAMDGNYNAENVYFDKDLITTSEIGHISLTDGQATIAAAGKNLKEVFDTIFVQEKNPKIVQPSLSLTFAQGKEYEVGNTITTSYSATFKPGSYEFGPATGIIPTSWEVSDTEGNTALTAAATLGDILITDDLNYSISATAYYGAGSIPQTNLKNKYNEGQILAGSVSSTTTIPMTGYRSGFYGAITEKKDNLTSEDIRNLTSSNGTIKPGDKFNVNIPIGAYKIVFAYPANLPKVSSIIDINGLYSQILNSFTEIELLVSGANDYTPIKYRVYYIDFANAYDASNVFMFTIGEED